MKVSEAIKARKAVKVYDSDHKITEAEIEKLLGLASLAPTAFNIQNWRFVVVQNPELRAKIREAAWDQAQVTDSSLLIVLTADLKSWEKNPERYWKTGPKEVSEYLVGAIGHYYGGKEQVQRDEAMRSCGIAAQTLMLAAQEMGYDSCPMDGFDFDQVGKLINLPEDHIVAMFVVIGKAKVPGRDRDRLPLNEVLIRNQF